MTLTQALTILKNRPSDTAPFRVLLACGFTPLHLETFLAAHLQKRLRRPIEVMKGLYGDTFGTLARFEDKQNHFNAVAVALEWSDLDPRLGYRSLGGWGSKELSDIEATALAAIDRLKSLLDRMPMDTPTVVSLPTLSLPPMFHTCGWESSETELRLSAALYGFAADASARTHIRIAGAARIAELSAPAQRFDLKSELVAGLPYTIGHAQAVSAVLANLIQPVAPKKGVITDLDDTFWKGIVGEVGAGAVAWDLANHAQLHGLYQQLLRSLTERGILVAVASKNSPSVVEQAFARNDIVLGKTHIFPVEVNWHEKSQSVSRILKQWNVGADAVVFVDDSAMELAEVKAAHPEIECMLFPNDDYAAALRFLHALRDHFGRLEARQEDALRLNSVRQNVVWRDAAESSADTLEALLASAEAVVSFDFNPSPEDGRILELVNKTNQFNLNGIRYTEADWRSDLSCPGAFVLSVAYRDKFGPLGKIAVVKGRKNGDTLEVQTWVMSCRAFSRRIEHRTLEALFDHFGVEQVWFDFAPTGRNQPLVEYFASIVGAAPEGPFHIRCSEFEQRRPALYHEVERAHA